MYVPVCSYDGHFWPKKKHLFYVGWGQGGDFQRYRLRFCAEHATIVDEYLSQFELFPVKGAGYRSDDGMVHCISCREPIDEIGWQVFITGYPSQDERKDYWGGLHVGHQLPEYLLDIYNSPQSAS